MSEENGVKPPDESITEINVNNGVKPPDEVTTEVTVNNECNDETKLVNNEYNDKTKIVNECNNEAKHDNDLLSTNADILNIQQRKVCLRNIKDHLPETYDAIWEENEKSPLRLLLKNNNDQEDTRDIIEKWTRNLAKAMTSKPIKNDKYIRINCTINECIMHTSIFGTGTIMIQTTPTRATIIIMKQGNE